jgi:hypothetical protein
MFRGIFERVSAALPCGFDHATGGSFSLTPRVIRTPMIFGHNTNLKLGEFVFHVQTEDRGESHALIDTTVYHHGRVLHRRVNNYFDLLPLNDDRREALRLRLEDQHTTVIEEIRSGDLQLTAPAANAPDPESIAPPSNGGFIPPPAEIAPNQSAGESAKLLLELTNAKTWLAGKHAKLQLTVRKANGDPANSAHIRVEIEGGEDHLPLQAQTNSAGEAHLEFEMPKIASPAAALVIHAENQSGKGHLRFALRAKPRVT